MGKTTAAYSATLNNTYNDRTYYVEGAEHTAGLLSNEFNVFELIENIINNPNDQMVELPDKITDTAPSW